MFTFAYEYDGDMFLLMITFAQVISWGGVLAHYLLNIQ